jgi:hypothetical protein
MAPLASLTFSLLRTVPSADFAPRLRTSDDTGASAFDDITKLSSPTIRLFAERDAIVTFYDGTTEIGHALSTGLAEITPTPLADGVHQITAVVTDIAGNVSQVTPALTVTIDTVPPATPTFHLDASLQDPVKGAAYTTASQATLDGQTEPGAVVTLAGTSLTTTADSHGNFTFTGVPLAVGDNALMAVATDVAGNTSQFSLTITRGQLVAPVITATAAGGTVTQALSVSGTVRSESAPTSFNAWFDSLPSAQYVSVLSNLSGGNFSLDAGRLAQINGAPLSAGAHVLHLVATDGNNLTSAVTALPGPAAHRQDRRGLWPGHLGPGRGRAVAVDLGRGRVAAGEGAAPAGRPPPRGLSRQPAAADAGAETVFSTRNRSEPCPCSRPASPSPSPARTAPC